MPRITLTNDQKAQLVGWLNREHDFAMSIRAMAERVIVPGATGSLELIRNDYEWVYRVRETIKQSREGNPELSEQDLDTLVDVARANTYADRVDFWRGIIAAIDASIDKSSLDSQTMDFPSS